MPCEEFEQCGAQNQGAKKRHLGDANPLVSVADGLGLSATPIASDEQDIGSLEMTVTCSYLKPR